MVVAVLAGLVVAPLASEALDWGPSARPLWPAHATCRSCGAQVAWVERLPVHGWYRRPCAACGDRRPRREVAVEAATPVACGLTAWWAGPSWALPAFAYLAVVAVVLTVIDIGEHRLPNRIVLPSYLVGAALLGVAALATGAWSDLLRAVAGFGALGGTYFVLAFIHPSGLGFGDVKLAALLGLYLGWLGWAEVAVGGFLGFLLGGLVGLVLVATGVAGRKTHIPFGPFMLLGAATAMVTADRVAQWYAR